MRQPSSNAGRSVTEVQPTGIEQSLDDDGKALPVGTIVGSYRIVDVLGAGGFGITYRAHNALLARDVALKEYFPREYATRDATLTVRTTGRKEGELYRWGLDRFLAEARLLALFRHPNIVHVNEVIETNGTAYIALAYERGPSLERWLNELGRPPSQDEIDRLLTPILDALEELHAKKLLHRDIAPDNIVLREDGAPVLIDFGAAKNEIAGHSHSLYSIVKAGYSPPEQYGSRSQDQGPWSDIYALGATLYRAAIGRPPPESTSRIIEDSAVRLEALGAAQWRPVFLRAIDAALQPMPRNRPRSVKAWRRELEWTGLDPGGALADAPTNSRSRILAAAALLIGLGLVYLAWPSRKAATSDIAIASADPKSRKPDKGQPPQKRNDSADALKEHDRRIAAAKSDCVNSSNLDLKIRSCTDVIVAGRADSDVYMQRGFAYNEKLDYERAIPDHDKAIELNPRNSSAYMNRGNAVSNHLKNYERAIADYSRAIEISPNSWAVYYNRGRSYIARKDWPQALSDLDKTIALHASFHHSYNLRSFVHSSTGNYEQAILDAGKAIEIAPTDDRAYYLRGFAHEKRRNRTQAAADYRKALEINASNRDAQEGLQRVGGRR